MATDKPGVAALVLGLFVRLGAGASALATFVPPWTLALTITVLVGLIGAGAALARDVARQGG
jgi:hypothetical protein